MSSIPPPGSSPASPVPFFTPGTIAALVAIVFCLVAVAWRPLSGPEAVSETESTALLELQSKLLTGVAKVDHPRAIEEARKLKGLAASPAGAKALASLYLYLQDDALRGEARQLLEEAPDDSAAHALLLKATQGSPGMSAQDSTLLAGELGWFGDLATAGGDEAARARVEETGTRLLLVVGLAGVATFAAFGIGLVLLTVAILARDRIKFRLEPALQGRGIYLQAFAIYLITMIVGGELAGLAGGSVASSSVVILISLLAGLAYPVLRGVRWSDLRRELGLHWGEGFWREAGAGVIAYVASMPIMAIGIGFTVVLQALAGGGEGAPQAISHPILGIMKGASWPMVALLGILAAVQGPVVEEIMFRGALYGSLRSRFGRIVSLVLMAVCFAAVHPQGLLAIPALMGLALAFGFMREWRSSLVAGIVTHGLHNGMLLAFLAVAVGG